MDLWRKEQERRGLSPTTIAKRASRLRAFRRFIGHPVVTATEEEVQAWLDSRKLGSPASRYNYLSSLATFYQWAVKKGHAKVDPTEEIVRPRLPRGVPRPISEAELERALSAADARMRSWLLLAAYEGLRCCEIAALRPGDVLVHQEPPLLFVVGKGSHERYVPLHPCVAEALRASGPPWKGERTGRPLTAANISLYIARFLRGEGIDATAHRGRHSFGTNIYESTGDLRLTQELMGHASPATTAIYTKVNRAKAVRAVMALGRREVAQPSLFDHNQHRAEVRGDGGVLRRGS